jgi:hypothetical protein
MKFPLKYGKGIIGITRKRTVKKAEKAFQEFSVYQFRHFEIARHGAADEARIKEKVKEYIDHLREFGFDEAHFHLCQHDYARMPRRAPRRKVKKEFDANGVPKVTKTPLDSQVSALLGYIKLQNVQQK